MQPPSAEPVVVQMMREFKRLLREREGVQMTAMATRWLDVQRSLEAEISALAADFADRRANNLDISQSALFRMERFQALLRQAQQQWDLYQAYSATTITDGQLEYGALGIDHAAQAIGIQYDGVGTFFDRLPVEAIENMVGLTGDGAPLNLLLQDGFGDMANGMINELVRGTALGRNPRRVARDMVRGTAHGLNRAMTIARTEQLRVYRNASQQQYEASGVVVQHRRLAAHDDRVCAACLMQEGEILQPGEPVYDHPNGRCSSVPDVAGLANVQWELGRDWIIRQDEATQRKILGAVRYDAWRNNQFDLDQLVVVTDDPVWGRSLNPAPLKALVA